MAEQSATEARLHFEVDGAAVEVPDDGASLLEVLRDHLGRRTPKDGCSPQGQCGCCTVLVDGAPRVACVTPARRVEGRTVTTLEGLPEAARAQWAEAFTACGASQCGFCTPGIIVRLEGHRARGEDLTDATTVGKALAAHLCRCTGWQTILEAAAVVGEARAAAPRDLAAAAVRAEIEGHAAQRVGDDVALGAGGFADDTAPDGALAAVRGADGGWVVAPTLQAARHRAGKVQGRRTTLEAHPPLEAPVGTWDAVLRTCWVEPAYLETDASWCAPGGAPADPLANGGAFGGKVGSIVRDAARRLADEHGAPVRALLSREDTVMLGPKRPPVAGGALRDGSGVLGVVQTPGIAAAVRAAAPGLTVQEVAVPGPPTSAELRAAGWGEALVLLAGVAAPGAGPVGPPGAATPVAGRTVGVEVLEDGGVVVTGPSGGRARAWVLPSGDLRVEVDGGRPLDAIVLRSYAIGAAHQALSWVTSEALAVDAAGSVLDLTVRSFGILRALDTPHVEVAIVEGDGEPVNASDAAFVAVAAAAWRARGCPPALPAPVRAG